MPTNIVTVNQISRVVIVEEDLTTSTIESSHPYSITIEESVPSITVSTVGIQGPPGPPGSGGYSEGVAGESISVYTCVVIRNDSKLYAANPTDSNEAGKILGVAIQSATANNTIQYVSTGTISGGSWTPGVRYFVGTSGSLTTSPRPVGSVWSQYVGTGRTSTSLDVNLGIPILLE